MSTLPYTTATDHIGLLKEKGYLDPAFGSPAKLSRWVQEFEERYHQAQYDAVMTNKKQLFNRYLTGTFDNHLEQISVQLRYEYHPFKKTLSLKTLKGWLGNKVWTSLLNGRKEPPMATELYENLGLRQGPDRNQKIVRRVQAELDRQNDPFNDPHLDMNHPGFNDVNDLHKDPEYRKHPPIDLSSFKYRPHRGRR